MRRIILVGLATLFALSAACAEDTPSAPGDGSTGSPSADPSPTGSPQPTPSESPEIEDGRHLIFVESMESGDGGATMTFDLAYFLTGEEAAQAAKEHGDESPPPNDYYIVNDNPKLRTLPVPTDVRIRIIDWANCCDRILDGDLGAFADAINAGNTDGTYRATSPYWITVEGGAIVEVEEQYLP